MIPDRCSFFIKDTKYPLLTIKYLIQQGHHKKPPQFIFHLRLFPFKFQTSHTGKD